MTALGFGWLSRFRDATAIVEESGGEISYAELARRCEAFAEALGEGRQLVLLRAANDLDSIVAYLSALGAGHSTILVAAGRESDDRIARTFSPTVVCERGMVRRVAEAPAAELHPDLALLLPTSGSTGSPKLVRLSHRNLVSNAEAIACYLEMTPEGRGITSLPLHYSYGLSVLNSHLAVGGSVVLTELSVTHPDFWALFRRTRATSIAGVPHSYELFERIGLRDNPPESLQVMTQAGGALHPALVKTYAAFGVANDIRFYAMYGQTEAAPRIAYLPPELALKNPNCIGFAIPGGDLRLVGEGDVDISEPETPGELVYRGPNVMMGYAEKREDLARGPEVEVLRTGDLAVRTRDGLFRIVGRSSRVVKIAGLRIGLDDLEAMLAEAGRTVCATGMDGRVFLCVEGGRDPAAVRDFVARRCGLPNASIVAFAVQEAPRLPSGKVDYPAIRAMGEAEMARAADASAQGGMIAEVYANALGIDIPPPEATFASLGGDSLSYVNASLGVERALGQLPLGWETMPIASLEAMVQTAPRSRFGWTWIETEMLVRVAAFGFVLTRHVSFGEFRSGEFDFLLGGSNILFALAGYNLARFQRDALLEGSVKSALTGAILRVILPYLVVLAAILPFANVEGSWSLPLLLGVFFVHDRGSMGPFWFIETMFHALLVACALFLVPPFRRFAARKPFASAMAMIAGATILQLVTPAVWNDGQSWFHTVDAWLYVYFLGWAAFLAREKWQKALVLALAALISFNQYSQHVVGQSRVFWLVLALTLISFAPRVRIPGLAAKIFLRLAAATYFIYITHIVPIHFLIYKTPLADNRYINLTLSIAVCVLAGIVYGWLWNVAAQRVRAIAASRAKLLEQR